MQDKFISTRFHNNSRIYLEHYHDQSFSNFTGRAFSAGGDLDWLIERHTQSDKKEENAKTMVNFYKMFLSLRSLQCPVIAAINGPAIGAGKKN